MVLAMIPQSVWLRKLQDHRFERNNSGGLICPSNELGPYTVITVANISVWTLLPFSKNAFYRINCFRVGMERESIWKINFELVAKSIINKLSWTASIWHSTNLCKTYTSNLLYRHICQILEIYLQKACKLQHLKS